MAYVRNNLVSRAGYSGVGGFFDAVGGALRGLSQGLYGPQYPQNQDLAMALAMQQQQQSSGMGTVLVVGGIGLAAFLLLRKKKHTP